MNRNHLLGIAFAVSIGLLVPTGAVPGDSEGVDRPDEMDGIELAPATGPNGKYAILNGDGEIEILAGEANPSVEAGGIPRAEAADISRIFSIANVGSTVERVWITDDSDAVTYMTGADNSEPIEGPENRVALAANESLEVGIRLDVSREAEVERSDSFTVHAADPGPDPDRRATDRSGGGIDRPSTETRFESPVFTSTEESPGDGMSSPGTERAPSATETPPDETNDSVQTANRDSSTPAPTGADEEPRTTVPMSPENSEEETTGSALSPVSPRSPATDRNRVLITGDRGVRSMAIGLCLAALAVFAALIALARRLGRDSSERRR